MAASLAAEGYLNESHGRFSIGFELLPLAAAMLDKNPLRIAALPHLQELAEKVGERTNLGIIYRGKVMILGGFERPMLPTIYSRFGRVIPPHRSALGKALLSPLSSEEISAILGEEPYEAATSRTLTTLDAVLKDFEQVRSRGYASEIGENSDTSRCIGAPIWLENGHPVAAISISTSSRTARDVTEMVPDLLRTAELISHVVRAQGSAPLEASRHRRSSVTLDS